MKKVKHIIPAVIIVLAIIIIIFSFSDKTWSLKLDRKEIESVEIKTYGVYGITEETIVSPDSITEVYDYLTSIKIGKKSKMRCDDNTKIYTLKMKNKKDKKIEIECSTILVDKKRYAIK